MSKDKGSKNQKKAPAEKSSKMGCWHTNQKVKVNLLQQKWLEAPRIVKIVDLYYLTYTAYDGVNALGAMVTSKDFCGTKM